MDALLIIAYISAIGVWGNLVLQSSWFIWSYSVHKRKHFTDSNEIDDITRIEKMYKELYEKNINEHKAKLNWEEFTPDTHQRGEDGKYNHKEIDGHFDGFFKETK